jgi:hypothetical protein
MLFASYVSLVFSYYYTLVDGSNADRSKDGNYSRIVIPDVILYGEIAQLFASDSIDPNLSWRVSSQLALSNINDLNIAFLATRNLLGPSFLAYLMRDIRFGDLLFNIILIGSTGMLFVKILSVLDIKSNIPLWMLFLNPETIYYSQGFLKEIPCLFLTTLFIYLLLKRKYLNCLLPIVLAIAIRYQIAFVLLVVLCLEKVPLRHKYKYFQFFLLMFTALLPLLYGTVFQRAVQGYYMYREESGPGSGIGAAIAYFQFNFPFFGYIGIPIRFFQTMIEPFPDVQLFSDGAGVINVYYCILSASMLMMSYFYALFFKNFFKITIRGGDQNWPQHISKIIILIYIYLLLVGVNTFISHRFMYAVAPLMSFIVFAEKRKDNLLLYIVISMGTISIYSLNMAKYLFAV